jgi:predicted nucleic acid-binding protein
MNDFLWDTYSIVALFEEAPAYRDLRQAHIITTPFAVMETCFILQRDHAWPLDRTAELAETLMESAPPVDGRLLAAAAAWRLRSKTKARHYSYADAFGYLMSRRLGLTFLTGDRAFEGLPGVEMRR